jgi:phage tail sheath gpL-like
MSLGLAAIILVGLSAQTPNPGTYVQVNFAAGPTSGAPAGQKVLIIGNKTSSGTATVDTQVYGPDTSTPAQTESDFITLTGAGSQVHRAWKRFNRVNKTTPVYFVCAAESAGAQATGVVFVTGTATSTGNIRFYYGDDFVDISVNVGDTPTVIAGNIVQAITNNINWAISATNIAGQITVTAKNHGPEGNWIKIAVVAGPSFAPASVTVTDYGTVWSSGQAVTTSSFTVPTVANGYYYKVTTAGSGTTGVSQPTWVTTIGSTTSADSNGVVWTCWGTLSTQFGVASLGGGATADNYTNALQTILQQTFYDIILCDSDTINIARVVSQVKTQANPTTGIRQRIFAGTVDTLANATTLATAQNFARLELQWANATDITPLEIAANDAAIYSLFEQSGNTGYRYVGRCNYSLFPTGNPRYQDANYWFIKASLNGPGVAPTTTQITSALNNGLTPITILLDGTAQLVKRITSYSLNGSSADYRIRDAHKVAIMDAWAGAAGTIIQQQFGGMDITDPPPPGQSPAAAQPPNPFATNVNVIGNALKDLTEKMGLAGLLQNTDATNANAIVQRETNPKNRVSASFDLQTIDIVDQFAVVANQVG